MSPVKEASLGSKPLRCEPLESLLLLPRLSIEGLMCIPPLAEEAETSRKYFVELRELRDALEQNSR
jgi:Predicted enzyme with a TIM-barrel fold